MCTSIVCKKQAKILRYIKEKLSYLKNLHILEKETFQLKDVTFICGTMWTDFNKGEGYAMRMIERRMNDFQIIKNSNRKNISKLSSQLYFDALVF